MKKTSRRGFLGTAAIITSGTILGANKIWAGPAFIPHLRKNGSLIAGVRIGVITYSFRDMPDQSAEATLQYIKDAGIGAIELMGGPAETFAGMPKNDYDYRTINPIREKKRNNLQLSSDEEKLLKEAEEQRKSYGEELLKWRTSVSMDKFKEFRRMYNDAGVEIYAFKPDVFGANRSDAEITYGIQAAKALGASHVTLEHPSNDAQTLRLGKLGEKNGMLVAYHGHLQERPTLWDTALAQSPANRMNLDFGHYVAAGNENPLQIVRDKHDKIASMHMKDRKSKANGQANMPWGEGDTPIVEVLQMMRDKKYSFPATIELEYPVPADSTPVAEVKKCVEYCTTALT